MKDNQLNISVLYVGTSLLAPLKQAEREINREYGLSLRVAACNFGASLTEDEWQEVERDLARADVLFVIHVMDGENASRLLVALEKYKERQRAVVVINCMPDLMRRTRMGRLNFAQMFGQAKPTKEETETRDEGAPSVKEGRARNLAARVGAWMGEQARAHSKRKRRSHTQYLKLVDRLPGLLRLIPATGRLRDIKNYLYLFCYFLQPTPANIRSMLLYALKHYVEDERLKRVELRVPPPEKVPAVAIYHPDAPALFESFQAYRKWYDHARARKKGKALAPEETIGFLLMRPQLVSGAHRHYDRLIRAVEAEGLSVLPVISTLMDNREACEKYFVEVTESVVRGGSENSSAKRSRVSQIVSLTGFSFVGGPAMNDSEAAARYLRELNVPLRSAVSLDMQTIDSWRASATGLNPVQTGMQVAIPELDGATEPFVFGGIPGGGCEPEALDERCRRLARRIARWNRLQSTEREQLKLALVLYCFPPNKGNIGTAAELDVFESVREILLCLQREGYAVEVPDSCDELRRKLLEGNSESYGATCNVAYGMSVDEYLRLCPHVEEIEKQWGAAPGRINSFGSRLLIQGAHFGNVFIGIQPSFGYEGDPMRLLMAQSGAPHHGFMAFYTYMEKVFGADAVLHVGTHGAMEFMPGKQVGLSESCWPDRLTGELPNIYIYSVNNPSEGTIAKRRSYAELLSYLTPPIENAGLYKELSALKELLTAYRHARDDDERRRLYLSIEETASKAGMKQGMKAAAMK
jgi:magnesium chelatase subunit H